MKKLILCLVLIHIHIFQINGMQTGKRKFDLENTATQMAQVRRINDIALIESIANDIRNKEESSDVKSLISHSDRAPILHAILASAEFESEWFAQLKNKFLTQSVAAIGYSSEHSSFQLKNMDMLLKHGADPEEKTEHSNETCFSMASYAPSSLTIFLKNGKNPDALFNAGNTLLMQATSESSRARGEESIQSTNERMNILLFFGANMHIEVGHRTVFGCAYEGPSNRETPKFIKHAHARRVNRFAQYFTRCTALPYDITLEIAQFHYGKLSDSDKELIKNYPIPDYKKTAVKCDAKSY